MPFISGYFHRVQLFMSQLRPIFFDLETTGIRPDKDRIVEIAAIDPYLDKKFQTLVNPQIPIPNDAKEVHGISDEMVATAPQFPAAAEEFMKFCEGDVVLIAHNGEAFDIPFLAAEFSRWNLRLPTTWSCVDSLKWARKYRKDLPRHSLQYLRQMYDIAENRAHRALDDVEVLYKVFSLMIDDLHYEEVIDRIDGLRNLERFQEQFQATVTATPSSSQSNVYSLF